jgi:iron complex outermembrane recepter protein
MNFNNEIVLNGKFGPNGLALTNDVEKSYRTGLEMSIVYAFNKYLSMSNHSSFNKSRIKEKSVRFSPILSPALIINQELNYTKKAYSISLAGRYQSASYIDFANSKKIDGYFLLNARAAYQYKKWELAIFLNNITNTRYFNNGYVDVDGTAKYFVQAPVNYCTSIKYHIR